MKEIKFVSAEELNTLEDYGAALLSSMISLKTLEAFHTVAFKRGILDEDEAETGRTICWEIQRLLSLYKTQIQNVLDRTELNEETILQNLRTMLPDVKIPRKRKEKPVKKDKKNEG